MLVTWLVLILRARAYIPFSRMWSNLLINIVKGSMQLNSTRPTLKIFARLILPYSMQENSILLLPKNYPLKIQPKMKLLTILSSPSHLTFIIIQAVRIHLFSSAVSILGREEIESKSIKFVRDAGFILN